MDMRMSPGIEQQGEHLPFAFKMGSTGTKGAGNQVVVNPPVSIGSDGAQVAEFSDPNKELFVLRIGKKSEGVRNLFVLIIIYQWLICNKYNVT